MSKYTLEDWQALELERNDTSWRKPAPKTVFVEVKTKAKPERVKAVLDEEAKKIYFNAGRFMGGDRDTVAVSAYRIYELIEGLSE
jgi:hypothetical protein